MERSIRLAERSGHARVWEALGAHRRASRALGTLASNLTGTAIVLACIILPLGLVELSLSVQEETAGLYIEALQETSGPPAASAPAFLLDAHFYFVNGCVAAPGACGGAGPADWGEYYAELRSRYEEAAQAAGREQALPFDEWAAGHAHFILSESAAAGATGIAQGLSDNTADGEVHVVGTSAGGAAVFTYLSQAMRGDVPFDRRIRSVMTVDSPLGYQFPFTGDDLLSGFQAGSMKTDVEPGIGAWAKAAGIAILTIDTVQDIVGYDPLPDVPNDPNPTYSQAGTPPASTYIECRSLDCRLEHMAEHLNLGSVWHVYTGSHMADSARKFAEEHWR
jgi:hypothetical protein